MIHMSSEFQFCMNGHDERISPLVPRLVEEVRIQAVIILCTVFLPNIPGIQIQEIYCHVYGSNTRVSDLECLMNSERLSPTIRFCDQPACPSE